MKKSKVLLRPCARSSCPVSRRLLAPLKRAPWPEFRTLNSKAGWPEKVQHIQVSPARWTKKRCGELPQDRGTRAFPRDSTLHAHSPHAPPLHEGKICLV